MKQIAERYQFKLLYISALKMGSDNHLQEYNLNSLSVCNKLSDRDKYDIANEIDPVTQKERVKA